MPKVLRSDYIKISRTLLRKLFDLGCFGKGSVYAHVLVFTLPSDELGKVEPVLEALVRQRIICRKKKEHGWKYYLNMERYDKIMEIIKERGRNSIIPILLMI